MLIELIILFQITAILLLVMSFWKGGVIPWVLAVILFSFMAFTYYNIEDSKTVVSSTESILNTPTNTTTDYTYEKIIESHKDLSITFLNLGLAGFCLVFFFIEAFNHD